jgi:hypothetical protein
VNLEASDLQAPCAASWRRPLALEIVDLRMDTNLDVVKALRAA